MLYTSLLFASTASATCLHGLSMFAKRAENAEGGVKVNTFGYDDSAKGPFNWASLAAGNEACKIGTNQSPINLDATVKVATEKPVMDIPEQEVEFENLGTTIEILVKGNTTIAGSAFNLVQFHMHTPSEHHINGEYHPLEIHMVHEGAEDPTQLAVVALMFQVSAGESSSIIKSLSSSLSAVTAPGTKTAIPAGIDFADVLAKVASSDVLTYSGSLTTPPCAEGVTFMIVKDPLDISVADFNAVKSIVKFNARYIQNTLGSMNMIEVGHLSGNATAAEADNASAVVEVPAAQMTPGHKFTVTELQGQPTNIAAIVAPVVAARVRKY